MSKKIGRPIKYARLFELLEPRVVYSASGIVSYARFIGYIPNDHPKRKTLERNIRSSCGYLIKRHHFPPVGDGMVIIKGQRPTPGWYGWRWQRMVREKERESRNMRLRARRQSSRRKRQ